MFTFNLKYGRRSVCLQLSDAKSVVALRQSERPTLVDLREAFLRAVETASICSPPLRTLLAPTDEVTLVISDVTRLWMRQDLLCELLVRYLNETLGIPFAQIAVLVALGTHRPQTPEELERISSPYAYARVAVVNHDCDAADLVYLGDTSYGTPVRVHPLAVGRKVITLGGPVHHLMSGYGGGRKSILPGICARETILCNHLHALSPDAPRSNPLIGMGKLSGNPLHEDMMEAAAMVAPVYTLQAVMNGAGQPCALFGGDWQAAWLRACDAVQAINGAPIAEKADVVIASCGGYPKDINLYQAVKTLLNAAQAVREGGTLVFLAECPEGGGAPEFFDWIIPLREGRLDPALRDGFTIAGYIFYAACEVISRVDVRILSALPADTVQAMGMRGYRDVSALIADLGLHAKRVYVIENGGSVVPYTVKNERR